MMHVDTRSEGKLHVCIFGISLFSALTRGSVVRDPPLPFVCLLLNIQHVGQR